MDQSEPDGPTFRYITFEGNERKVLDATTGAQAATVGLARPWGGIYGEKRSEIVVSRYGYLSLDPEDPGDDNSNDCVPAIPSSADDDFTRVFVAHQHLTSSSADNGGSIYYEFFPESPHPHAKGGVHVVSWLNFNSEGSGAGTLFQVLLFDNLDILIQLHTPPGNGQFTTGIQNDDATVGLEISCDTNPLSTASNQAYLIRPPILEVTTYEDQIESPAGPQLSLREAIRDAASGSRIEFANNSVASEIIKLSASEGGQGNRFFANKVLAIDASRLRRPVILSGGKSVHHFSFPTGLLYLDNRRLVQGFGGSAGSAGGSVKLGVSSSLIAQNCLWEDNSALSSAGAISGQSFPTSADGIYLQSCDFLRN